MYIYIHIQRMLLLRVLQAARVQRYEIKIYVEQKTRDTMAVRVAITLHYTNINIFKLTM